MTGEPAEVSGVLVVGTDTGVGKTVLSGALCAALRARGVPVAAAKPVVTGTAEPEPGVPLDHELLAACTGQAPAGVTRWTFGPAVSPHLAAEERGVELALTELVGAVRDAAAGLPAGGALIVEGVGGLLVPFSASATVRDLAVALGLPVVVAARPGLGTINHTLLTVEAARSAGLDVRAVVMTPWPDDPTAMERSNRRTVAGMTGLEVQSLPPTALEPRALAAAGSHLPVDRWLGALAPG